MKKEKLSAEEIIKCPHCKQAVCKQTRSKTSKRIDVPYFYGGIKSEVKFNIPRITVVYECPRCKGKGEFSFFIPNLYGIILPFKGECKEIINRKRQIVLGKKDRVMRKIYLKLKSEKI